MIKISGIYKIQSISHPERLYIGSTMDLINRWKVHIYDLKRGTHNPKLQRHVNKYGIEDLHFIFLLGCDKEDLMSVEQFFLDSYVTWFNICPTAYSNAGNKSSEETCKKISIAMSGENHYNYGGHKSEEHKASISATLMGNIPWNKGIKATDEAILNLIISHKGQIPWNKGKKGMYSEESIKNLQDSHKGHYPSEETKKRMSDARKEYINKNKKVA